MLWLETQHSHATQAHEKCPLYMRAMRLVELQSASNGHSWALLSLLWLCFKKKTLPWASEWRGRALMFFFFNRASRKIGESCMFLISHTTFFWLSLLQKSCFTLLVKIFEKHGKELARAWLRALQIILAKSSSNKLR